MVKITKIFTLIAILLLSACSSQSNTKGTGSGTDDYKVSPCACVFHDFPTVPQVAS